MALTMEFLDDLTTAYSAGLARRSQVEVTFDGPQGDLDPYDFGATRIIAVRGRPLPVVLHEESNPVITYDTPSTGYVQIDGMNNLDKLRLVVEHN